MIAGHWGVIARRCIVMPGVAVLTWVGCSEPAPTALDRDTAPVVSWVIDAGNAGDATDLRVRLRPPVSRSSGVTGFRVFLVAEADDAAFDETTAEQAPKGSFLELPPCLRGDTTVVFGASTSTTGGDPIGNGERYVVRAQALLGPESASVLSAGVSVALEHADIVETIAWFPGGTGGLEIDAAGNVYAADFGASLDGPPGSVIRKVSPEGVVEVWAEGLVGASGNALASNGDLFQSNIAGASVSRITPDGETSTFAQGLEGGPVGIAVSPGDTLHVVNCGRGQIHRISPDGQNTVWVRDPLLRCPNGITLADDGNFYVANFDDGAVLRVTPDGDVSVLTTLPGGNLGHLLFGNGVLYVVARGAHQIYQVTLEGRATLLAGSGTRGALDGTAVDAQLSLTNDLALSPDGRRLYFNDVVPTTGNPRTISPTRLRAVVFAR